MSNYLNGVEILGTPKTVRLEGQFQGLMHSGPLEVWVAALIAVLTPEQKTVFFETFDRLMRQRDLQPDKARVVANIPLPRL